MILCLGFSNWSLTHNLNADESSALDALQTLADVSLSTNIDAGEYLKL